MDTSNVLNASDPRRWWALALLCGAFFTVALDATIVLVAGRPRKAPQERLEAVPLPIPND